LFIKSEFSFAVLYTSDYCWGVVLRRLLW